MEMVQNLDQLKSEDTKSLYEHDFWLPHTYFCYTNHNPQFTPNI